MELVDTSPVVDVHPAEYGRLLGYPPGHVLTGRAGELAQWAREWYGQHGRPWIYAREAREFGMADGAFHLEGAAFYSTRLRNTLEKARAHGAILAAVSAGPELEEETQRLWREERPDEYFFLEIFGSAVTEHLATTIGARLCAWAAGEQLAVLPHYSPGYAEWNIADQPRLLALFGDALPAPLAVLDSGMLRPKKSLLAVFGVTRHTEGLARLTDLTPCSNCTLPGCQYRRKPHRLQSPLDRDARYAVNLKALKRWAVERLTLEPLEGGGIEAVFRYDGTTCTNMGRPLEFHYRVKLGPRTEGYRIEEQCCGPAPNDTGHRQMCGYKEAPESLMAAIRTEQPLLGRPLNAVLEWRRQTNPAGCYCHPESREHKWGLVLETIHFALAQRET